MFCSTQQPLCVFTRTSEGKAEHATVALEHELASKSIVDAYTNALGDYYIKTSCFIALFDI